MRPLLVRLPNWIGDVVMALPALEHLESQGWRPELVGKGWAATLLGGHPWVVHRYPSGLRERMRTLRRVARDAQVHADRAAPIDCLLLTNSFSSALEARLAGLHALGHASDGRRWLLARSVEAPAEAHEIDRFDGLARALGRADPAAPAPAPSPRDPGDALPTPRLIVGDTARHEARRLLEAAMIGERYACIVPFATGTLNGVAKAWPAFPDFTGRLSAQIPVVVLPGPGEEALARSQFAPATALTGVGLDVYAAILASASVVIANDTGPGHIAAAVGAPLISVLGPTDAARYGARGAQVQRLQALAWPSIDAVIAAVDAVPGTHKG